MDRIQTFKTPHGDEMVILPKADYERLVSHQTEDQSDSKEARKILRRVEAGSEPLIPLEVYKLIRHKGMSRLRAWRTYRGISGEAMAAKLGISRSYMTQLENGLRKGSLETMGKLAAALGTTLDGLTE